MSQFLGSREIQIDAGHRIPDHHSKCKNLHGHRYRIELRVHGGLQDEGSETGMIKDFGILKRGLVEVIDERCDHAFMISVQDPWLKSWVTNEEFKEIAGAVREAGFAVCSPRLPMCDNQTTNLYVMESIPTAENLARHWYTMLRSYFQDHMDMIHSVKVWETPNCYAIYPSN